MSAEPHQNLSKTDEKVVLNPPTMESVLECLSDSSVESTNKVNSMLWFDIPIILTDHIQSQPTKQNNEVLSQLLQRMMTILDECSDSHCSIANKRLLHTSLSQLSQSPSLDPKIKRETEQCLASLEKVDENPYSVVPQQLFESVRTNLTLLSNLQQKLDELQVKLVESERKNAELEREKAEWIEKEKTLVSTVESLQREKQQFQLDHDSQVEAQNHTIRQMTTELPQRPQPIVASDVIVAFNPNHFRVSGSTVTNINPDNSACCFTKPVSKGIHRLSIRTEAEELMIGVLDAAEYPNYLTSAVHTSPKAALMYNGVYGHLWTADKNIAQIAKPRAGQEWSAEADLEKRTLHFFLDGVQQPHHFINIPVPLVFAINSCEKDGQIEITFWGELKKSSVTFAGTGHNLG
ncbi:hypothetical protein BLNAU_17786 [Blattamonas nauphoetae]|uniref:Uncharacterized protein n=1 Tax=Blattamonas nauphoetae TaxID=2049346 RepID=A0ABQ9X6H8_9EUKA|nr:hypothetical protein BLNAU_17786 [Blattamonas nauphoetae]